MPSGIMAQLSALRVWAETAKLPRFGMHPTSHLALHEDEAYAALLRLHAVPVGDRLRPLQAGDLDACRQPLACLLVELPIREAGGQLPTWDELEALKAAARTRGLPLHMDGARLWECGPFYGKSYAEIASGFDSVYVSVYKGIGALAGAVLAGSETFVAQARRWRRRMGGTLVHLSPMVASAAMRFDQRLAMMPALVARTRALAAGLAPLTALRVNPALPPTNLFHLYFDAPADTVTELRDEIAGQTGCWLFDRVRPADVPGWSLTELYIGDRLLAADDPRVIQVFAQLDAALRRAQGD
jgi:threonine aldolase